MNKLNLENYPSNKKNKYFISQTTSLASFVVICFIGNAALNVFYHNQQNSENDVANGNLLNKIVFIMATI